MNEQAEIVLAEMLQRALDGVDAATEFSKEQIPEVVEQLLMWHMVYSAIITFLGILLIGFACRMSWFLFSRVKEESEKGILSQNDGVIIGGSVGGALLSGFMVLVGFMVINLDWLQILIAPKLYLLEYAAEIVK